MDPHTIREELLALERKYWQTIQDKDVDAALALTDDPCLIAGAQGVATVDSIRFRQIMHGAKYTLHSFSIDDQVEARLLNDTVAVLAYNVHEELTVEGKPVSMDASDASVWVRRDGRWLCALHTESLLGDPYGRDKAAAKS